MTIPHFVDSHCHLYSPAIINEMAAVVAISRQSGVVGWVVPGVVPEDWPTISRIAGSVAGVMPAYGVHPQWATCWNDRAADALRHMAANGVAIGEIGLDYSAPSPDRLLQQQVLRAQIRIAREAKLPVIIHCRRASADFLAIAKSEGVAEIGGIMHAFSGSLEMAKECTRLGLLIGVAGPVTYGNAARLPQIVTALGLQSLVLETDSPDLAPEPWRGTRNTPANLLIIAKKVAELCEATLTEVAAVTTANIRRLLSLQDPNGGCPDRAIESER